MHNVTITSFHPNLQNIMRFLKNQLNGREKHKMAAGEKIIRNYIYIIIIIIHFSEKVV